jgi:hypothetical protein
MTNAQSEVADEKPHELRALFDSLDINGDGNVSKKELVKALKSRESDFYQVTRLPERTSSQRKSRAVARFFSFSLTPTTATALLRRLSPSSLENSDIH